MIIFFYNDFTLLGLELINELRLCHLLKIILKSSFYLIVFWISLNVRFLGFLKVLICKFCLGKEGGTRWETH